jgi:hypothetical protein
MIRKLMWGRVRRGCATGLGLALVGRFADRRRASSVPDDIGALDSDSVLVGVDR